MFAVADALRLPLADQSVDLVLGSPPYCDARTYNDGTLPEGHVVSRECREWVDWMLAVTTEALRVSRGAVIWVAAGVTRDRTYWPACEGLMWRWWSEGYGECGAASYAEGSAYRPCYWNRVGISGSGGDQWFRSDVEYAMCFKRPGPLPWVNNTAMGQPPKWAPGGAMSYRAKDGSRKARGAARAAADAAGVGKTMTPRDSSHWSKGDERKAWNYVPPEIANPGNLVRVVVGGGRIGSMLAHENEAPYPEKLAEWFIAPLCPPGGLVCDPFSGSGTTVAAALPLGRRGIGFDLRQSQARLSRKRCATVTPGFTFQETL
jgi:hypothetical protein